MILFLFFLPRTMNPATGQATFSPDVYSTTLLLIASALVSLVTHSFLQSHDALLDRRNTARTPSLPQTRDILHPYPCRPTTRTTNVRRFIRRRHNNVYLFVCKSIYDYVPLWFILRRPCVLCHPLSAFSLASASTIPRASTMSDNKVLERLQNRRWKAESVLPCSS